MSTTTPHAQRQRWWWWALMLVVVLAGLAVAGSSAPGRGVGQARLFSLSGRLKCMQCVGESVAASQAPLAVKFRAEIDDQMRAGRTDDEILNYFARRYGQEVLLTPPSSGLGALVWVLPVVGAAGAALGLVSVFLRWRRERGDTHATPEDETLVAAALASRHVDDTP